MLLKTGARIIVHEKEKFAGAVAGVTIAVFLMILQWGFYLGFDRDITIVLDSVDADIWVIPKNQPLFDGWSSIDDLSYWQALEHPGIENAARMVWGYAPWRIPTTGGKDSIEVLGVELDTGIEWRLNMPHAELAGLVRPDGNILVAEKDREKLGVTHLGIDGIEINGRKANAVGFVEDIHLFTTAGFIVTDLEDAQAFLRLPPSHVSYVVCKCREGQDIESVVEDLQRLEPDHDVMSTKAFHDKSATYWTTRTGIGPLLMLSAVLAVLVGFLIVMLAFYVSTIEKIPIFACMKALGASNAEIFTILASQVVVVYAVGCILAGIGLYSTVAVLEETTISVVITRNVVLMGLTATALCSASSTLLSIRRVITTDPGEAFRT